MGLGVQPGYCSTWMTGVRWHSSASREGGSRCSSSSGTSVVESREEEEEEEKEEENGLREGKGSKPQWQLWHK